MSLDDQTWHCWRVGAHIAAYRHCYHPAAQACRVTWLPRCRSFEIGRSRHFSPVPDAGLTAEKILRDLTMGALPTPLRGVNLGGFLIIEPYLKPSLFKDVCNSTTCAIDEHSLCEMLGQQRAREVMQEHWATWVTLAELRELKEAGVNALRIPVLQLS